MSSLAAGASSDSATTPDAQTATASSSTAAQAAAAASRPLPSVPPTGSAALSSCSASPGWPRKAPHSGRSLASSEPPTPLLPTTSQGCDAPRSLRLHSDDHPAYQRALRRPCRASSCSTIPRATTQCATSRPAGKRHGFDIACSRRGEREASQNFVLRPRNLPLKEGR